MWQFLNFVHFVHTKHLGVGVCVFVSFWIEYVFYIYAPRAQ